MLACTAGQVARGQHPFVVLPPKVLRLRICRRFLDKNQAEVDFGIWPLHILVRGEGLPEMNF